MTDVEELLLKSEKRQKWILEQMEKLRKGEIDKEGFWSDFSKKRYESAQVLLNNIKEKLPEIKKLFSEINAEWSYEDGLYRFYHYSYKVYFLQTMTEKMVVLFDSMAPGDYSFSSFFIQILKEGTGKKFSLEVNDRWTQETRPIVEAFLHAKYFLEMMVKYGEKYEKAPNIMDYGWAALLELYNIR